MYLLFIEIGKTSQVTPADGERVLERIISTASIEESFLSAAIGSSYLLKNDKTRNAQRQKDLNETIDFATFIE